MESVLYRCDNQGITAITTSAAYELIAPKTPEARLSFEEPPLDYPRPIFTFAPDLVKHDRWRYLTGTLAEMDRLIKGFEVRKGSFYVPFSNGFELSLGVKNRIERGFCTTLTDLFDHLDIHSHYQYERLLDTAVGASSRIR